MTGKIAGVADTAVMINLIFNFWQLDFTGVLLGATFEGVITSPGLILSK